MRSSSKVLTTFGLGLALLAATPLGVESASAQTPTATMVVLDLQPRNVSAIDDARSRDELTRLAQTATQALRQAFRELAPPRYTLVEASEATRPNGSASSPCDQIDCAVTVGRAMAAERVVTGTVTKVSTLIWFVTVRAIDVPSGQLVREIPLELKGDISQLLPKGMASLARWITLPDAGEPVAAQDRLTRQQVLERLKVTPRGENPDLAGAILSGLDLSGLNFKEANLSGSNLSGANLADANLFGTNLTGAVLQQATLTRAILDVAVLRDANLRGADLSGGSLYATILSGADLTDANLSGARVIAVLTEAKLVRTKLAGVDMGADRGNQPMGLMRTDLTGADLSDADLAGANLAKVNLTRADLTGADLTDADLSYAELGGAILRSIRGRGSIRGLETAKDLDQAIFDPR